jgi:hypothetical protein
MRLEVFCSFLKVYRKSSSETPIFGTIPLFDLKIVDAKARF